MDGQNAHAPHALPLHGDRQAVFRQAGEVDEKGHEALMASRFKPPGLLVQGHEVGPTGPALGHGGKDGGQVGALVDVPQQLVAALLGGQGPQLPQEGQEGHAVRLLPLGPRLHRLIHAARAPGPQLGQTVRGEGEHRGAEDGQQGHVLPGVVHHLQQGDGHRDLGGAEELPPPFGAPGDARLVQGGGIPPQGGAGGAEQNHHVVGAQGAVPDGKPRGQQLLHPPGHQPGLHQVLVHLVLLVGQLGQVHTAQLGGILGVGLQILPPVAQGLVLIVVQLSHGLGHDVAEDKIGTVQHLRARAEVGRQRDGAPLPFLRGLPGGKATVLVQEDGGVCQAEAVDGLLHISHQKQVVPLGQGVKNGVLHSVGVLVLVHHDLHIPLAPLQGQGRGVPLPVGEEGGGEVLSVGKVDEAVAALEGHKGPVELRHHVQQGGHGGGNGPQVLHSLRSGDLEALFQLLQLLFAGLPQSLGPLLQSLVAVPPLGLGALKGHLLQGLGQLIPALGLLHPLQAVNGGTQGASIVVPQNGVLLQLLQHPLEGVGPILGQFLGI